MKRLIFLFVLMKATFLGKARSKYTLAHELGHSIMNLEHTEDPKNMMYPYGFGRSANASFNEEQCQSARSHYPWVQKIKQ